MAALTNHHAHTTFTMMGLFYLREEYWDVQLEVDGRPFKCHRVLLAATSMYFDTLFKSPNFKESYPTSDTPIILHELDDATAFEEIIYIMYSGDIFVNDSNVLDLLSLSKFLELRSDDVRRECLQHLTSRFLETITQVDAIDLLFSAMSKEQSLLVDALSAYIFKHLYHFLMDVQLTDISLENLKALLVCGERIIAPLPGSLDVLLAIILNWVNTNREERRQYRCELIDSINRSKVSSEFTSSHIHRLEEAVDEGRLRRFSESLSESNPLDMEVDIGDIRSSARLCATISFNVENVSKMENGEKKFSPAYIVSNLSFKTCVERKLDRLKVSVRCDGTDLTPVWSCYARAIFTIKTVNEEIGDLVGDSLCDELSSAVPEYLVACQESWDFNRLIKKENGFIKVDDSITVVTLVYAGVPCTYID